MAQESATPIAARGARPPGPSNFYSYSYSKLLVLIGVVALGPRAVDLFIVPSCFLFGPKLCRVVLPCTLSRLRWRRNRRCRFLRVGLGPPAGLLLLLLLLLVLVLVLTFGANRRCRFGRAAGGRCSRCRWSSTRCKNRERLRRIRDGRCRYF